VLEAIDEHLDPPDRAAAQAIIEAIAASDHRWSHDDWLRMAVRRHRDEPWLATLVERASIDGPEGDASRYLLEASGVPLTLNQKDRLAAVGEASLGRIQANFEAKMRAIHIAYGNELPTAELDEVLRSLDKNVPGVSGT
jgi:hypothetical protein